MIDDVFKIEDFFVEGGFLQLCVFVVGDKVGVEEEDEEISDECEVIVEGRNVFEEVFFDFYFNKEEVESLGNFWVYEKDIELNKGNDNEDQGMGSEEDEVIGN